MLDQFKHWERLDLRWGDQDALGHVNNARYFTFFESARLSFLDRLGVWPAGEDLAEGPILASISCNFRRQLKFPATLRIGTRVSRIGGKSFTLAQAIFRDGESTPAADGDSVIVWFDYGGGRTLPLPEQLRAGLLEYAETLKP